MEKDLTELGEKLAAAELRGDASFLESTLADDFVGIGPRGFMLTKEEWLERHKSGDLKYESFTRDEVQVRLYGEVAVVTGRETTKAKGKGQEVPRAQFRTSQAFVKQNGRWLLAGIHLSSIVQGP